MLAGEILILTGPPGSGKTTTARRLAAVAGASKVHLHADFWHFIGHGAIAPYLPEAHEQNRVVIDVLAGAAARYAAGGYFVIVDGILGPWFLDAFRASGRPLHYVVLRPALDVAIRRCRERGGETLSDPAAITSLYDQLSNLDGLEKHVLSTGDRDPEQVAEMVRAAVTGDAFRLG